MGGEEMNALEVDSAYSLSGGILVWDFLVRFTFGVVGLFERELGQPQRGGHGGGGPNRKGRSGAGSFG